jgi:hypothetical protein
MPTRSTRASMIRDAGYLAMARPVGKPDEMVIATAAGSPPARWKTCARLQDRADRQQATSS